MVDVHHEPGFLTADQQNAVLDAVWAIEPGFYVPRTRWGRPMSIRMNCLGHHWSARDYRYHQTRKDVDGLPCPAIPELLQYLATDALRRTGYWPVDEVRPFDICIANFYTSGISKLGDHVDNSESPESIASGYPVVSMSIGDACVFRMGGLERTNTYEQFTLASGDLLIFGRSRRLAYHGVKKVLPGTCPSDVHLPEPGRLNLTFRLR